MKRILLILLVALLLAGCAPDSPPAETTESTSGYTEDTEQLYVADSAVEQQTGGAVKMYATGDASYSDLYAMGANLLLVGQDTMLVLTGERGEVAANTVLAAGTTVSALDVSVVGAAYYNPGNKTVQIVNPHLQSAVQLQLPENVVGAPVIALARNEIYYSTGDEIRAMNTGTGISRLVRRQSSGTQSLLRACFDGTVLLWQLEDEKGQKTLEYISAETGQTLASGMDTVYIETYGQRFFALFQDGDIQKTAVGTRNAEMLSFLAAMPSENGGRESVLSMNGIVDYAQTQAGLELSYYDLNAGKRTAGVTLPGVMTPEAVCSDGSYVWLLAADSENSRQALYRWDITKSAVADEAGCVGPLYTAANPDTEGLKQCRELADSYEKQYGVKILLWQDAGKQTGDYTVTVEHQPEVLRGMLENLQPALAQFPDRFLLKTVEKGWVRIALVRSIAGGRDWAHFWAEGDCWILISTKGDAAQSFYQGVAYAIDSHVLGNSRDFDSDRWNPLNPEGFAYAYSYNVEKKPGYLSGDNRAFTDLLAMSYPHEDRSRVFYHAVLADNGEMFQSPILQAKLLQLCMGIREAYGLEKKTDTYIWEQYLQTPIAYVKK